MSTEGTKHDLWLSRINVWIAILGGFVALIIGAYNLRQMFFPDSGPGDISLLVRAESGSPVARACGAFDVAEYFARRFGDRPRRPLRQKRSRSRQLHFESDQERF